MLSQGEPRNAAISFDTTASRGNNNVCLVGGIVNASDAVGVMSFALPAMPLCPAPPLSATSHVPHLVKEVDFTLPTNALNSFLKPL